MLTLADGKRIDGAEVRRAAASAPATYRSLSPGGGGFGDPKTRDPDRVLRDVRDGIVSREAAPSATTAWRSPPTAAASTTRAPPPSGNPETGWAGQVARETATPANGKWHDRSGL